MSHLISCFLLVTVTLVYSSPSHGECACGQSAVDTHNEISGGNETRPHQYPWIVRLIRGCHNGYCVGSLVSPRVVLTAFHCARNKTKDRYKLCDHSDGKRLAIIGAHRIENYWSNPDKNAWWNPDDYYTIPVIKAFAPPNGNLREEDFTSHDFALLLLQHPVEYSYKVGPICLPTPNTEFGGQTAVAAGWGQYEAQKWGDGTVAQSPVLREVKLNVSTEKYKNKNIFGTVVERRPGDNQYMDPCSGDSGGPLMFYDKPTSRYVLIGTLYGGGYNCESNTVNKFNVSDFETSTNGIWNKVSAHMEWITKTMDKVGEKGCNGIGNVIKRYT